MMKKFKGLSKTIISSFVIFQLVFASAALPVVSYAFEDAKAESSESASSETKGETGPVKDESDKGEKEEGGSDTGKDNPSTEEGDKPSDEPKDEPKEEGEPKEDGEPKEEGEVAGTSISYSSSNKGSDKDEKEEAYCEQEGNLIQNGGFEYPVVSNNSNWDIFENGTSGLGWTVTFREDFTGAPEEASLEIQTEGLYTPSEGNQYAELDSDWYGPTDGTYGEEASVRISQMVDTTPGVTYTLRFAFAGRPGYDGTENHIGVFIGGPHDMSPMQDATSVSDTFWYMKEYTFTAYDEETEIAFEDLGNANSVGTFIDNVTVTCEEEPVDECPVNNMIYARVKLTPQPYGWRNWGNGNTSGKIFVGGSDEENVYLTNEWFPLTNPNGTFINDTDMEDADYADVPGLALQRNEGSVRIVLYGYLYEQDSPKDGNGGVEIATKPTLGTKKVTPNPNYYLLNRELSQGSLEFSTDMTTRSTTVIPLSQVSDSQHPMDHTPGVHQYHPESDSFRLISNLSQWHMVVTSGADGFYTYYETDIPNDGKDCPDEEDNGTLIVNKVIQGQGNGIFNFSGPNGNFDITTSNGEGSYTISNLEEGNYSVTESDMAGWDIVSSDCDKVFVPANGEAECTVINTLDDSDEDCESKENDCPETSCDSGEIWARININDLFNLGTGDVTSNVYLGSDSNVLSSGEWFMVYDGTNYVNDPAIENYEDVTGLVVQRMDGKIRILLHGSSTPSPYHKEYIEGNVEFFNALATDVYEDNSGNNKLEDGTDGMFDYISYAGDRAYFEVQVDTGDDGWYVDYEYSIDEDCDDEEGENNPPVVNAPETACILTTETSESYNFLEGVTSSDPDGDSVTVDFSHNIVFGTPGGPFTITYSAYDPDGASSTDTTVVNVSEDCDDGGTGGGDDDDPVLTIPGDVCIETNSVESFDLLEGVSAIDFADDPIVLVLGENLIIIGTVDVGTEGAYPLVYTVTDPFGSDEAGRTITVADDCDNGGGGGGGSSSGSSRGGKKKGEVLGVTVGPACVRFTEYYDTGDRGGEIEALQKFLNAYMGAGLVVDGVYGISTTQAVHNFQAMYWDEVIDPWTPPLSPNTTGRFYKTTRATVNAILGCPEETVFLEDPMIDFLITEVADTKEFDKDEVIASLLSTEVIGK